MLRTSVFIDNAALMCGCDTFDVWDRWHFLLVCAGVISTIVVPMIGYLFMVDDKEHLLTGIGIYGNMPLAPMNSTFVDGFLTSKCLFKKHCFSGRIGVVVLQEHQRRACHSPLRTLASRSGSWDYLRRSRRFPASGRQPQHKSLREPCVRVKHGGCSILVQRRSHPARSHNARNIHAPRTSVPSIHCRDFFPIHRDGNAGWVLCVGMPRFCVRVRAMRSNCIKPSSSSTSVVILACCVTP